MIESWENVRTETRLIGIIYIFLQADQGSFVLLNKFTVHTPTEDQVSISFETSLLQDIHCGTYLILKDLLSVPDMLWTPARMSKMPESSAVFMCCRKTKKVQTTVFLARHRCEKNVNILEIYTTWLTLH